MTEIPSYHDENFVIPKKEDFKRFKDGIFDEEGWDEMYKKDHMKVFTKNLSNSNIRACKARAIFEDVEPEELYNVLHDHDFRKTWDENMMDGHVVELINKHTEIGYYAAKMPSVVSNRDFCNLRTWKARPKKGEWIIFNFSVRHQNCPEKKGFVRANSILTGYFIRKLEEGGIEFNYYSQSDPKGWIPSFVINTLMTKLAPRLIEKLHSVALTYKDWKKENNPEHMPWLVEE